MKPLHTYFALFLLLLSTASSAQQIYKHIDAQGKVTYSSEPIKGGKKVDLPPLTTITLPKPPEPKTEPKVEPKADTKGDAKTAPKPAAEADKTQRVKQLQESISQEEKALELAKLKAKEGDVPEFTHTSKTVIGKNGKPTNLTEIRDNPGAYEEKMKRLNGEVTAHEKKLAGLKAELRTLDNKP